jgi:hypothetical protein
MQTQHSLALRERRVRIRLPVRHPLVLAGLLLTAACAARQPARRFIHAGVIEGFYGTPWSHRDRLDLLRFMGRVGLNTYVYAPKDDPYHRERWRQPYPPAEAARLHQLVDTARAAGVSLWYAVSPGGSMTYADSGDYAVLVAKLAAVRAFGVTTFGLFLDDVPATLSHELDRRRYGSLAAAHASLINRLAKDVAAWGDTLVVTPTTYTDAWGDQTYLTAIGPAADTAVAFFWTGSDVASPTVTAAEGARWKSALRRPMLLWDNYPVNDFAPWRPFLGPVRGRALDLASSVAGILANPMNQAHASMIALATLADYARDPAGYDPAASWRTALHALYGDSAVRLLQPFLDAYGDYPWDANPLEPMYFLGDTVPAAAIGARLDTLDRAIAALHGQPSTGSEPLAPLVAELEPFVTQARQRLQALRSDTAYQAASGALVYRAALDRYDAPSGPPIAVDGRLDDWAGAAWHPLRGTDRKAGRAEAALRWAGESVYLAIRVRDGSPGGEPGDRVGEGDHVQLIVHADSGGASRGLSPSDLVVLVGAPGTGGAGGAYVGSLAFTGFVSKWRADDLDRTFTEFDLTSFGGPHPDATRVQRATAPLPGGYGVEIALPRNGRNGLRLSLSVKDTGRRGGIWALALRNYPGNPATFARVVFR